MKQIVMKEMIHRESKATEDSRMITTRKIGLCFGTISMNVL